MKSLLTEPSSLMVKDFSPAILKEIDLFQHDYSGWTEDDHTNKWLRELLHNYTIKLNEEIGFVWSENLTYW